MHPEIAKYLAGVVNGEGIGGADEDVRSVAAAILSSEDIIFAPEEKRGERSDQLWKRMLSVEGKPTGVRTPEGSSPQGARESSWRAVSRLEMRNFRGILGKRTVEFSSGFNFFHGPNGSGKSSVFEALEYALTGSVNEAENRRYDLEQYLRHDQTPRGETMAAEAFLEGEGGKPAAPDPQRFSFCFIEKNRIEEFSRFTACTERDARAKVAALFGIDEYDRQVGLIAGPFERHLELAKPDTKEMEGQRSAYLKVAETNVAAAERIVAAVKAAEGKPPIFVPSPTYVPFPPETVPAPFPLWMKALFPAVALVPSWIYFSWPVALAVSAFTGAATAFVFLGIERARRKAAAEAHAEACDHVRAENDRKKALYDAELDKARSFRADEIAKLRAPLQAHEDMAKQNNEAAQALAEKVAAVANGEAYSRAKRIFDAHRRLHRELVGLANGLVVKTVGELSAATVDFYNEISVCPGQEFTKISGICFPRTEGKGSLTVTYSDGKRTSDAVATFSEGNLRVLGVSMLLAKAKRDRLGLLVLDDVVNAVDTDRRAGLRSLLVREFGSSQVVIMSHDENFLNGFSDCGIGALSNRREVAIRRSDLGVVFDSDAGFTDFQKAVNAFKNGLRSDCLIYLRKVMEAVLIRVFAEVRRGKVKISPGASVRGGRVTFEARAIADELIDVLGKTHGSLGPWATMALGRIGELVEKNRIWKLLNEAHHYASDPQLPDLQQVGRAVDVVRELFEMKT